MFKRKAGIGAQSMPTSEDLAKWGAYELSFEELLEVNGGKRDRSGGKFRRRKIVRFGRKLVEGFFGKRFK